MNICVVIIYFFVMDICVFISICVCCTCQVIINVILVSDEGVAKICPSQSVSTNGQQVKYLVPGVPAILDLIPVCVFTACLRGLGENIFSLTLRLTKQYGNSSIVRKRTAVT